jgi:hypothetical protein
MARMRRYDPALVEVEHLEDKSASWDWLRRRVRGTECLYEVRDRNYERNNRWVFVVQQPRSDGNPIIVRPRKWPEKAVWERIWRRSIVFNRATKRSYRGKVYCKMTLADPSGVRTKIFVRDVNRKLLPKWFDSFRSAMRRKITVATTKGMDQDHHVVLANPEDHTTMIRLFFALKVWVLNEGFSLG